MLPTLTTPRDVKLSDGRTITVQPQATTPTIKGKTKKDDDKWWLFLLLITAADIAKAKAFWVLFAPASFAGLLAHTNGFGFDTRTQQWTKNHKPLDHDESRAIFLAFLARVTTDMEKKAGKMARGRMPLDEWEEYQGNTIKSLYITADAIGRGGASRVSEVHTPTPTEITDKVPTDLPGALRDAVARLKRFGGLIEEGEADSVDSIVNRAALYADPAHGVMENARRESHADATDEKGVKIQWLEENALDDGAAHCKSTQHTVGCPEITEAGPAPLGTYDLPGERTCRSRCRCHMRYSVAPPNQLSDIRPSDFAPGKVTPMSLAAERIVNLPGGRKITIALALSAEDDGHWVTIDGTHVHIRGGKIDKGPASLIDKNKSEVANRIAAEHGKNHPVTKTPEGPSVRDEYRAKYPDLSESDLDAVILRFSSKKSTPSPARQVPKSRPQDSDLTTFTGRAASGHNRYGPDGKIIMQSRAKELSLSATQTFSRNPMTTLDSPRIVNLKSGKTISIPVLALSASDDDSPKMSAKADKKSATSFEMASKKTDDDYNPKEARKAHLDARAAHMEAARSHEMAGGREMAMHHRQCANIHDCMAAKA
jgi:hypothetical protein